MPVTLLWVAGVINALNLIDGLDGLAGGVALAFSGVSAIALGEGKGGLSFEPMALAVMFASFSIWTATRSSRATPLQNRWRS